MRPHTMSRHSGARRGRALVLSLAVSGAALAGTARAHAQSSSPASASDPRVGLGAGWMDAKEAARNLRLVAHVTRPDGFFDASDPGKFALVNSDLAFREPYVFQGNYNGFQIWDISNPDHPTLKTAFVCPGGQGDMSVYGHLLFMSAEETRGRVDCGTQGVADTVSPDRFRGVRIFDISDLEHPKQLTAVQTCRGSHTHTLVIDPKDHDNVYIYVSGTSPVRPGAELAGCSNLPPGQDPNTSLFRIDVIKVPLAAPQNAKVVSHPRIFADSTGAIAGLWKGGDHGPGTQTTSETNQCHDVTVYSAIGLAAGACSGNGILLDVSDPVNPKRVAQAIDPNFAYWHSATFSNDGSKVIYTDEWGGGVAPRCRASDPLTWGADAIFTLQGRTLRQMGYFKMPAPQTEFENCVAHNGSLIPVPGRDIMVQAWYQGGISVFDFTDPAHPQEIAFFDRGPVDSTKNVLAGFWSAYWYNGRIFGSEIARGLDEFELTPSEYLSDNEIAAAKLVHVETLNPQNQQRIVWPASFVVARAYLDQLVRGNGLPAARTSAIAQQLDDAEKLSGKQRRSALNSLSSQLRNDAKGAADAGRVRALTTTVDEIARGAQ